MANWSRCRHEVDGKSRRIYINLDNVLTVQQNDEGTVATILMVGNVEVHVDETPEGVGVYD